MPTSTCVFCGRSDISREDALPTWLLRKLLAPVGSKQINGVRLSLIGTRTRWPDRYDHRVATGKDVRVPVVCEPCNNGWMNQLERLAGPYLGLMVSGLVARLKPDDKRIISAWAAKTAMMLLYFLVPPEPPHATYLATLFRDKVWAPVNLGVWLATYSGETPAQFSIRQAGGGTLTARGVAAEAGHCVSLCLGALVIQVWLWDDPTKPPRLPPFEAIYADRVMRIWPGTPDEQEWPPSRPFGDIDLWRYFGKNEDDIRRAIDMLNDRGGRAALRRPTM